MGFAAEIKEFLGAAKDSWKLMSDTELKDAQAKYTNVKAAAEQKEMDDPLNQKIKEATLAHKLKSTANIGRESPLDALRRQALQLEIDAARNPPREPVTGTIDTSRLPAGGGGAAAPPGGPVDTTEQEPYGPPVPKVTKYKRGGLVRKFAVGGIVEDEDLEDDEVTPGVTGPAIGPAPTTRSMAPAPAVGTSGATDLSAQRRPAVGATPLPRDRPQEANALSAGLKYGAEQIHRLPAIGSARSRGIRGYAQGAGAAPPTDMVQIYEKIDPTGKKYTEAERNLIALNAVHSFKMNQGDPEGAAKSAFQMLQHFKTAQARYGALAAVAMKGGNVDEGIKLALKQYANIPDGNDLKMWRDEESGRIGWQLKDKDGKKISGGVATPEEIGAKSMGLATPGGFENHLVQMTSGAKIKGVGGAGTGEKEDEPPVGGKPMDPAKQKVLTEETEQHVKDWAEAAKADPANKGKEEPSKSELAATKNALFHLRRNNDMTNDEGMRRIQRFTTAPETYGEGEQPAFKTFKDPDSKMRIIQFDDGFSMKVPESDYSTIRTMRTTHLKNEAIRAKKEYDAANAPSGLADAVEGIKAHRERAKAEARELGANVKEAFDTSTLKAVGKGIGNVASEAGEWLSKANKTIGEKGGAGAIAAGVGSLLGGSEATAAPAVPAAPYPPDEDRPL